MKFDSDSIKPGDTVAVSCRGVGTILRKVARVTATQVRLDGNGSVFQRKTGKRKLDSWTSEYLEFPVSDETLHAIAVQQTRLQCGTLYRSCELSLLPPAMVRELRHVTRSAVKALAKLERDTSEAEGDE